MKQTGDFEFAREWHGNCFYKLVSSIKTIPIHGWGLDLETPLMKRILIVDDESLIGYALAASLRRDDTYIKAVECGKDALSEINHIFYNLVFLDIKLPDACGLDIMKVIKKTSPGTFIVIMTGGVVNDPELMKSIVANAHLFISKPFDLERVKLFVNRFIGDGTSRPSGRRSF